MIVNEVLIEASALLQDTSNTRFGGSDLLTYFNDGCKLMATVRPELFTENVSFTCISGSEQLYPNASSMGLSDVIANEKGDAIRETNTDILDAFRPGWGHDTAGSARNWARQKGSNYVFYLHPPAANGTVIEVQHIKTPSYQASDTIDGRILPFSGALAEYVAGTAQMREQESTQMEAASLFKNSFLQKIGGKK